MSSNPKNLVVSPFTPRTKFVDENGYATWEGLKFLQGLAQAVNGALIFSGSSTASSAPAQPSPADQAPLQPSRNT
jgi:hypothetical protein